MKRLLTATGHFLKSHGMEHFIGFKMPPVMFWFISVFCGVFCLILCRTFGMGGGIFQCFIFLQGVLLPAILLCISNENDNGNMLKDIKNLFEMLKIQIHAGIYMVDALENCCTEITNKRLLRSLNRLLDEIYMSRDVTKSLENFSESFCNQHIDTLAVILQQSMETGYSKEYLDSAFEQVLDVEQAIYIKTEQSVERTVQVMQVLFMAGIIGISVYCSIVEFKGLFEIF